jgi:hypothetical protein
VLEHPGLDRLLNQAMPLLYKALPPLESLQELFEYDPSIGQLRWKARLSNRTKIGAIAGTQRPDGYYKIRINGNFFYSHRVIWYMLKGEDPGEAQIDHIDGRKNVSKIENLRIAEHWENCANKDAPITNTSGLLGVSWDKSKQKWSAKIGRHGKTINLGRFDSAEQAAIARRKAELEFHGEFSSYASRSRT